MAKTKMKRNKYNTVIVPNFQKIKDERAKGASLDDLADMLECSTASLYRWRNEHKEFGELLDEAEQQLYSKIEATATHSLLDKLKDRMMTVEQQIVDGIVVKEIKKLVKADTTAVIFALKARNPEKWDSIAVAKLETEDESNNLNNQILDALQNYNTNKEVK